MNNQQSKSNTKRRIKTGEGDPWAALAGAILIQAVNDARAGDCLAAAWLEREGLFYLEGLGLDIDSDHLRAWIRDNCPKKPVELPRLKKTARFPGPARIGRTVGDPGKNLPGIVTGAILLGNGTKKHQRVEPLGKTGVNRGRA